MFEHILPLGITSFDTLVKLCQKNLLISIHSVQLDVQQQKDSTTAEIRSAVLACCTLGQST